MKQESAAAERELEINRVTHPCCKDTKTFSHLNGGKSRFLRMDFSSLFQRMQRQRRRRSDHAS